MPKKSEILIEDTTVSDVSSVVLNPMDSTYNVYKVVMKNIVPATDNQQIRLRLHNASGVVTSSNYDTATFCIKAAATFEADAHAGETSSSLSQQELGTTAGEVGNGILYIFNSQTSEATGVIMQMSCVDDNGNAFGSFGEAVLNVSEAHVAVEIFMASGNISGSFKLYGLVK
tara:strand:- start:51 stop:566 length:516 start_codon:yes stop_codon:yes gene_type:complete